MTQPQKSEKTQSVNSETFIGKRIVFTNPPSDTEVTIDVVSSNQTDPHNLKLAPNAPIIKALITKGTLMKPSISVPFVIEKESGRIRRPGVCRCELT